MPKMDLVEAHMFGGQTYGPGAGVELPADEKAQKRIKDVEKAARVQMEAQLRQQLSVLPSGHPYFQLLGVQGTQPPAFEGEPSPVGQVAPSLVGQIERDQTEALQGELGDGLDPTGQPNAAVLGETAVANRQLAGAAPSGATSDEATASGPRRAPRGSPGTPPPAETSTSE